jgi:hypothetical protein
MEDRMTFPAIDLDRIGLDRTPIAEVYRHVVGLGVPVDPYMPKAELLGRLIRFLQPRATRRQLLLDELASLVRVKDTLERRAAEIVRELAASNTAEAYRSSDEYRPAA